LKEKMSEEKVYIAEVLQLCGKSGPGGALTLCQLKLQETNRTLYRAVLGPVREGDLITLLDHEREHRKGRF
jgi:small subunit ribosomal protein S28e